MAKADTVSSLKIKAKASISKGDYKTAIALYEKIIGIASDDPNILNEMGELYRKAGKSEKAKETFWKALEQYKKLDYYTNAIAIAQKLLKLGADQLELYSTLGELYDKQGLIGDALSSYNELAERFRLEGDMGGVLETYKKMVNLTPKKIDIRMKLVDLFLAQKMQDNAIDQLEQIEKIFREQGRVDDADGIRMRISSLSGKAPKVEEKTKPKKQAPVKEEKTPEPEEIVFEQTAGPEIFEETLTSEEIQESLEQAISTSASEKAEKEAEEKVPVPQSELTENLSDWSNWVGLADLYMSVGSLDEAIEYYYKAADAYFDEKDYENALPIYNKIAELKPFELMPRQKIIQIATKLNNRKLAVEGYISLADCLSRRGAKIESINALNRALKLAPKNTEIREKIGELEGKAPSPPPPKKTEKPEQKKKEKVESIISFDDLLKEEVKPKPKFTVEDKKEVKAGEQFYDLNELLDEFKEGVFQNISKEDFTSHYDLGITYKEMGLIDEAIHEFEIASAGKREKLKSLEMLAVCFEEKGNIDKAEKLYLKGLATEGYKPEEYLGFHYRLGVLYQNQKRFEEALKEFGKVIEIEPTFRDIKKRLQNIRSQVPPKIEKKKEVQETPEENILEQMREEIAEGLDEKKEEGKTKKKSKKDRISYV